MKKFKVTAVMSTYLTVEIEAEDGNEAYALAQDMDGADFEPISPDAGDWRIYDVIEIK